jgi:O-antigen ligase
MDAMKSTEGGSSGGQGVRLEQLVFGSLVALPYLVYGAIAGLVWMLVISLRRWGRAIGSLLQRQGWGWLTLWLLLGVAFSQNPGESALQITNFVPFFVFYGAIAVALPHIERPVTTLHHWALALLLGSLPVNMGAIAEFYLRAPATLSRWGDHPWLQWLYTQHNYGHRASSIFGHPNALANYMVIVFGLGLGLCAFYLSQPTAHSKRLWVCGATALALVGIFCSGSRNGLLIAGLQLLLFGGLLRPYRYIFWAGLGAIALMFLSALVWGVGGRSLGEAFGTIALRFHVWQLALDMIPLHPWFGTGLGTFKDLYDPTDFPASDFLPHAHSLWLMLAAEAGIPAALGLTAIVGWVVGRSTYNLVEYPPDPPTTALLAGYLTGFGGTTAFAIFDVAFYDGRINILGWLILGVIQAITQLTPRPGAKGAGLD